MHNILLIFRTRSEAIKTVPIINKLKESDSEFNTIVYITVNTSKCLIGHSPYLILAFSMTLTS